MSFIRRYGARRVVLGLIAAALAAGPIGAGLRVFSSDSSPPLTNEARYRAAVRSLNSAYGITVTNVEPSVTPRVSETRAFKAAGAEARFLGGKSPFAHLVYYTDRWSGTQTSDADGAPIIPLADHRLTWLVLGRHARVPIMGPDLSGYKGPMSDVAAVATFVDATTGKVIKSSTIDDFR